MLTKLIIGIFIISGFVYISFDTTSSNFSDTIAVNNNSFAAIIPLQPVAPIIAPRMMSAAPEPAVGLVEAPASTPQVIITPDTAFTITTPEPQVEPLAEPTPEPTPPLETPTVQ